MAEHKHRQHQRHQRLHATAITAPPTPHHKQSHAALFCIPVTSSATSATTTTKKHPPSSSSSSSSHKIKVLLKTPPIPPPPPTSHSSASSPRHAPASSPFPLPPPPPLSPPRAPSPSAGDDLDTDDLGEKPFKKRKLKDVAFAAAAAVSAAGGTSNPPPPAPQNQHKKKPPGVARPGLMSSQIASDKPQSKGKGIAEVQLSGHRQNDQQEDVVLSNKVLEGILDRLQKKDTYGVFSEPVDPKQVPDYYDVIKSPMDFGTMRKKIIAGVYGSLEMFQKDIFLICSNAMRYNARDTIYYRQARSIQDAARKLLEALKAGLPFEGDQKSQRSPVKKLSCKRPPAGKFRCEPTGSDYTSGATLATCDYGAWMNGEVAKGGKVAHIDRAGVIAARNLEGQAFSGWGISGNGNGLAGSPSDCRLDFQDDLSGLSIKSMTTRDGKKVQLFDENRRSSYRRHNSLVYGVGAVLRTSGGEQQQLVPVGYQQDYAYARSLARFAADLGPSVWKIAAEKIHKSLPPGVPFGPGWVLDPPPGVVPVLTKGQPPSMLQSESRVSVKAASGFLQVGNVNQQTPTEAAHETSAASKQPIEKLMLVPQLMSKCVQPNQLSTQTSMKLSLTGANLTAEVSQSKLLEIVSQNGRLVSWASGKQIEQAATVSHSQGLVVNPYAGERMQEGHVGSSSCDNVNFLKDSKMSTANAGLDFSSHASSGSQSGWSMLPRSSQDPSMQNLAFSNSGNERQQAPQAKPNAMPGVPPAGFTSLAVNNVVSTVCREDSRMLGWVHGQPADSSHTGTRLKPQIQLSGSALASQLLANSQYNSQLQDTQEILLQQHEFQARLATAQQEMKMMSMSVPQLLQHQFPCDVSSYVQRQVVQMHPQASGKQGGPLGSPVSCTLPESNGANLQSRSSGPIITGSTPFSNQSWGFVPMQYPLQQASNLLAHSLPPDLNVSLPHSRPSLDQASGNLSDSQQPDLALQL